MPQAMTSTQAPPPGTINKMTPDQQRAMLELMLERSTVEEIYAAIEKTKLDWEVRQLTAKLYATV